MSRSGIFQSLRRLVQAAHLADSLRISSRESLDLLTDRVGQVAENGGEVIDNLHKTMLGLAREFDLQLEDVNKPDGEVFYNFFGQSYSEAEVVDDFRRFVPTIKRTISAVSPKVTVHTAMHFPRSVLENAS